MSGVKFEQRIYQENLILKKVLQISVVPLNDPLDPLANMTVSGPVTFLPAAYAELFKDAQTTKSFLDKKTLFDTIFSDILASPKIHGLIYLLECHRAQA